MGLSNQKIQEGTHRTSSSLFVFKDRTSSLFVSISQSAPLGRLGLLLASGPSDVIRIANDAH